MLARIALRMATIAALKGKTLVGGNVLDSEITALDADADGNLTTDQQKPFITVYTHTATAEVAGRTLHISGLTELVIEVAVAATMVYRNDAGDKEVAAGIPSTDSAFEFFLDVVAKQITNALSDPQDAWAEIWRGLSSSIVRIERKRTSDATGTRIAAHQIVITLNLRSDPVFGEPVAETSIWAKFFGKLAEPTFPNPAHDPEDPASGPVLIVDPIVAAKAVMLQGLLGSPAGALSHDAAQRRFGLTFDEAAAMLLVPASDAIADAPILEVNFGPFQVSP